jgi:hypothetical protein
MKKYAQGGIYHAGMGQPPVNEDGMPGTEKKRPKNTAGTKVAVKPAKKMASGGYVRAADGCATKGKTKGTMVKMAKGGKTC